MAGASLIKTKLEFISTMQTLQYTHIPKHVHSHGVFQKIIVQVSENVNVAAQGPPST